jgi:beta-N-acetylhexosaminidase
MGSTVIRRFQQKGIMAVAKHFPGIGRTTLDSHLDMPVFHADLEDLHRLDLIPFQAAIRENVSGIMLSHTRYDRIDPQWPASMSERIVRHLLRETLGYQGVVITDDLDMGAVQRHFDIQTAAAQVVAADVDIALICHEGPAIEQAWETIRRQIPADDESLRRAEAANRRIMALKKRYLGAW